MNWFTFLTEFDIHLSCFAGSAISIGENSGFYEKFT